jgi:hypothetical protein
MKSALIAVAITALMGGLAIGPVTHQSAEAQVHGGLKGLGSSGGTPQRRGADARRPAAMPARTTAGSASTSTR